MADDTRQAYGRQLPIQVYFRRDIAEERAILDAWDAVPRKQEAFRRIMAIGVREALRLGVVKMDGATAILADLDAGEQADIVDALRSVDADLEAALRQRTAPREVSGGREPQGGAQSVSVGAADEVPVARPGSGQARFDPEEGEGDPFLDDEELDEGAGTDGPAGVSESETDGSVGGSAGPKLGRLM